MGWVISADAAYVGRVHEEEMFNFKGDVQKLLSAKSIENIKNDL